LLLYKTINNFYKYKLIAQTINKKTGKNKIKINEKRRKIKMNIIRKILNR